MYFKYIFKQIKISFKIRRNESKESAIHREMISKDRWVSHIFFYFHFTLNQICIFSKIFHWTFCFSFVYYALLKSIIFTTAINIRWTPKNIIYFWVDNRMELINTEPIINIFDIVQENITVTATTIKKCE